MSITVTEKNTYVYVKLEGDVLASSEISETISFVTGICKEKGLDALVHRANVTGQIASMNDSLSLVLSWKNTGQGYKR